MVNGPPGTSTSDGSRNASAGAGPGAGAASTGAPARIWWVISIVSSCCASCWAIIPNANPSPSRRVAAERVAVDQVEYLAADLVAVAARLARRQRRRSGRSARGCSNASYSGSISGCIGSRPPTARSSQSSSWLAMFRDPAPAVTSAAGAA